jgi:hypothetical protein
VTAWRDRRLVTYEEVRYLDAGRSLVVETTMSGRPNKRTTVYTRVSPPQGDHRRE